MPMQRLQATLGGIISGVAINNSNQALFVGNISGLPYAAFTSYASPTPIPITNLPNTSNISSAAINDSGKGIIGGTNSNTANGALVDFTSNLATPLQGLPSAANSNIFAVAINNPGDGLVGGASGSGGYAAIIPSGSTTAQSINLGGSANLQIFSVALNDSGNGIVGGVDQGASTAYAGWVNVGSNSSIPIDLTSLGSPSSINYVAINSIGQALIAGFQDSSVYYFALLQPLATSPFFSQIGSPISPSFLTSASFISFLNASSPQLPTECLTKNNLKFANYINENAQQDVIYFIPDVCDSSLKKSLESAAPTRNALSLFAADQNLFYLNHGLSDHLRYYRHFINRSSHQPSTTSVSSAYTENQLLASSSEGEFVSLARAPLISEESRFSKEIPNTLWIEGLGVLSHQKAQHQTVGFDPKSIGVILAYDRKMTQNSLFGLGAAYTFTHIKEEERAGHSHIHQEYLFLYAAWANDYLYVDGALWGALFQTDQVRHIHMTGFDFISRSTPSGEQLSPHLEIGYENKQLLGSENTIELIISPFLMGDWANSWQKRYKERGDSPFNAAQKAHYSSFLRTETGLRLYETFTFTSWYLVLSQKVSYVNKTPFGVGRINSFLVGSPGSFTLETLSDSQNLGAAEFALIFEPANHKYPYGSVSYQGEFNGSFQSHEINLELSWAF